MSFRRSVVSLLATALALVVFLPAVHSARSSDDHLLLYGEGLRSFDFEKWEEALMLLSAATEIEPVEGEWVRLYGMRWEPYLPYYHRAVALARLGRYKRALEQIDESLAQGAISAKKNKRWKQRMLELQSEIEILARERAGELLDDAAAVEVQLTQLRETQPEPTEAVRLVVTEMEQEASRVQAGQATPDAVDALEEKVTQAWRELAAAAERERQARQRAEEERRREAGTRYAAELEAARAEAEAEGCQEAALARLEGLQDPPPEVEGAEASRLLGRELATCGRYDFAREVLQVAGEQGVLDAEELSRELAAVTAAQAAEILAELRSAISLERCDLGPLRDLPAHAERGLLAPEWQAALSATGLVACGRLDEAAEALAEAERIGAPAEALQPVRAAIESTRAELRQAREAEAAKLRIADLRQRLETGSCDPRTAIELAGLVDAAALPEGWGPEDAPPLLLASEHLECGDLEAAEGALAAAPPVVAASAAASALAGEIAARRREEAQRLLRLRLLGLYAEADVLVRIGECDENLFRTLEEIEAAAATDPALLSELDAAGRPVPLLRALGHMNCDRATDAREATRSLPDLVYEAEGGDALRRWLAAEGEIRRYTGSHALLSGMSDYGTETGWPRLPGVRQDIEEVGAALEAHGFAVERAFDVAAADFDPLMRKFISDHGLDPDNRLVVYYAGHGWTESNLGIQLGYVVPVDAAAPVRDKTALLSLVSMNSFEVYAKEIRARHVAFFFDSCFSGTVFDATRSLLESDSDLSNAENLREPVRLFVTAGGADQEVPDESVFRRAMVGALAGDADLNEDGLILGSEIGSFVRAEGSSDLNTPLWGRINHPSFNQGDLGFRGPARSGASLGAADRARLRAELAAWSDIKDRGSLEGVDDFLQRFPSGLISRSLSRIGAVGP